MLHSIVVAREIVHRISFLITPWRLKVYPVAALAGLCVAVLFTVLTARDGAIVTGRLGGDFPAFYAAGKMVTQGESHSIYDPERILSEQQLIIPTGGYLPFVNPPHFAYFYALFGAMPYNFAFLLHYCFLVFLLAYIVKSFISLEYIDSLMFYFALISCLAFYPILRSVLGGQNSVLSLFLLFMVWKFADSGREWMAGLCLGLLLYKPQFAIPFIGLFFLAGYWRVAVSGVLSGIILAFGTIYFLKHNLLEWLTFAFAFSERDAIVNKFNSVSLSGFVEAFSGGAGSASLSLAGIGAILVVISISALWYQGKRKRRLNELMAAACPAVLLIPQHVMYYDLSICVLSVLLLMRDEAVRSKISPILWISGFMQMFSQSFGFSPLFLVVLGMYLYFLRLAWSRCQIASLPGRLTCHQPAGSRVRRPM